MTTTPRRRAALAGTALGLTLALGGCAADGDPSGMPSMGHPTGPGASSPATSSASAEFNDADVMFAQMMIPHHRQAVEMSDLILAKPGVDPEVTALAKQIKAAQQPEIDTMTAWLKAWGKPTEGGSGGMNHGADDQMMTPAEMDRLKQASGTEGQKLFLAGMVKHHQGAVLMAQREIANGRHPDAIKLAEDIVRAQNAEIATMQAILERL